MRLISGYNPEEHFDEFEDDDIIARWICRTEHLYNYICELKMRKKNTGKWRDIAEQAESSYNKMGDIKDELIENYRSRGNIVALTNELVR